MPPPLVVSMLFTFSMKKVRTNYIYYRVARDIEVLPHPK